MTDKTRVVIVAAKLLKDLGPRLSNTSEEDFLIMIQKHLPTTTLAEIRAALAEIK